MRPCFVFAKATAADAPETLMIFDEIGFWGVQAKDFVADLGKVESKVLNVEINSPGGDVFAALSIYNALRASGKEIVTKAMGVAASAASLVFMAGDKRVMPKNTQLMIHNPWSFAMGNADELRETADTLDKIGASIKATYAARSGLDDAKLSEMLAKDTWISADEAVAYGFATEVVEDIKAQAKFDMARADLPESVKAIFAKEEAPAPATPEPDADDSSAANDDVQPEAAFADQVLALAEGSGFAAYAAQWAVKHKDIKDVESSITTAREVKALCDVVKMGDKADAFIKAGKSLDEVRDALVAEMAANDENRHVDTTPKGSNQPTQSDASQSAVKTADIWAKRRNRK